jgi:serine/threonine protein kinase
LADDLIIGGYRRVNIMQTGQNSEVWEVADTANQQRFALKLLLPERVNDRSHIRMIKHEMAVSKTLDHPKIIKIHGLKRERDLLYLVMEYFPSINLKLRLLKKDQYENFIRPNLRKIIEGASAALTHMHEKKWVHRDIKPDNLLVNSLADIRLIDFALAVRPVSRFASFFWGRQAVSGTRSYMSPEQILARVIDHRSDIYSLGIVLYEICAGKLPYFGASGNDLLRKHLSTDPPRIPASRGLAEDFEKLLFDMLKKKPKDRPADLNEVLARLRRTKIFKDEKLDDDPSLRGMG